MLSGNYWLRALGAGAAAILSVQGHAANLLTNGSFELPPVAGYVFIFPGSTFVPGWTVAAQAGSAPGTHVQPTSNSAFGAQGVVASQGSQFVDLTGNVGRGGGLVSNAFATSAGSLYRVSFDIGAFNVGGSPFGDVTVDLFINNVFAQSFTNVLSLKSAGSDWQSVSWDFAGTGGAMTVGLFSSLLPSSSNLGVGLDNVSVDILPAAVPEPASWAMMLGGMGLAGAVLRRRRTAIAFA